MKFTCAILIVSDTCFNKIALVESGPALADAIKTNFPEAIGPVSCTVVPDNHDEIIDSLETLCKHNINLILTMGGTGLQVTDIAMLSRSAISIKDNSVVINLPENLTDALECFRFIKSLIPHSIDFILNRKEEEVIEKINEKPNKISKVKFVPAPMMLPTNNTSPFEAISFDTAFNMVLRISKYFRDVEEIAIEDSLNRILACEVISNPSFPAIINTSMINGYALIAADGIGERIIKTGYTADDDLSDFVVKTGEIVSIRAGAHLPKGADAVVSVEDTIVVEAVGNEMKIKLKRIPDCGEHIRSEVINDPKEVTPTFINRTTITPAHIAILPALGYLKVKVYKRARIGILSTGEALYSQITTELSADHSINSNNLVLLNLLKKFGYTSNDLGIVKHHPNILKHTLHKAFINHDVIITTGGVSVTEYEVMKKVLEIDFGATILFDQVNMEPGYLTTFATCSFNGCSKFIFSLPGDLNSTMIVCRLLVVPALRAYENSTDYAYNLFKVYLNCSSSIQGSNRCHFKRVILEKACANVTSFKINQANDNINNIFNSCAAALLIIPENSSLKAGYNYYFDAIMLYS